MQTTDYPAADGVTLTLTAQPSCEFTVFVRIPAWAGKNTTVAVNGRRAAGDLTSGFFPIRRTWKTGDRIDMEIDQALRYEPVDAQTPNQVALLRGPQVMFALSETQPKISRQELARPTTGNLPLRPFGAIRDEVYQTYWQVSA